MDQYSCQWPYDNATDTAVQQRQGHDIFMCMCMCMCMCKRMCMCVCIYVYILYVWIYRLQFPILESMYCTKCNIQHKNLIGFLWYLLMDTIRFGEGSRLASLYKDLHLHLQTRHPVPMRCKSQYKS